MQLWIYPGQTACSPDRGCGHGEGPCTSNSDCLTAGHYYECSTNCVDRTHFPLSTFPHLAEIRGYEAGTKCCRRRCTPQARCGHDTFGCDTNQDCNDGHECVGTGTNRKCMDINECTDNR